MGCQTRAMTSAAYVRVSLVVPAKPGRIFDVLATPYRLPEIDPSMISDDNDSPVTGEGQVFVMNMVAADGSEPVTYRARHQVNAFKHNRLIGWDVIPDGGGGSWSWRLELAPIEGKKKRTEVALTYDWSTMSEPDVARFGVRDEADLLGCLQRLVAAVQK